MHLAPVVKFDRMRPGVALTPDTASSVEADALLGLLQGAGKTPKGAYSVFLLALATLLADQRDPLLVEETTAALPRLVRDLVAMVQADRKADLH